MSTTVIGGVNGTLHVYVRRAKHLPNLRKLEKQSPFVLLRLGHLTKKTNAHSRGGQTPAWDYLCEFELTPEIKHTLQVDVFDETKKAPKLIGRCEVDITPAFYSTQDEGYDDWHELYNGQDEAGLIYLEITFFPKHNTMGSRGRQALDGVASFYQSVAGRAMPELPELPSASTSHGYSHGHSGYSHASETRSEVPSFISSVHGQSQSPSRHLSASPPPVTEFSSSAADSIESPFARLKQLKEKLTRRKVQDDDSQIRKVEVDQFEDLQRAVQRDMSSSRLDQSMLPDLPPVPAMGATGRRSPGNRSPSRRPPPNW